jgi:pyruvate formate lyase activating enzyme
MKECKGRISSIYNGTALDGPGIRCIVFMAGCNMRCPFCHNPETFDYANSEEFTAEELCRRILRYRNYIEKGGVTFSGGEPFLQAEFCIAASEILKKEGLNIAAETNCSIVDEEFISVLDLIIADIKNQSGFIDKKTIRFLDVCAALNKPVFMTNVLIKGVNDCENSIRELKALKDSYKNIGKFEFLPFKKLCEDKYKKLGIAFGYKDKEETDSAYVTEITEKFYKMGKN